MTSSIELLTPRPRRKFSGWIYSYVKASRTAGVAAKGGPPNGLFLQLVDTPDDELPVPERNYTFKEFIAAQATGDHRALQEADRTVLRVRVDDGSLGALADVIKAKA